MSYQSINLDDHFGINPDDPSIPHATEQDWLAYGELPSPYSVAQYEIASPAASLVDNYQRESYESMILMTISLTCLLPWKITFPYSLHRKHTLMSPTGTPDMIESTIKSCHPNSTLSQRRPSVHPPQTTPKSDLPTSTHKSRATKETCTHPERFVSKARTRKADAIFARATNGSLSNRADTGII